MKVDIKEKSFSKKHPIMMRQINALKNKVISYGWHLVIGIEDNEEVGMSSAIGGHQQIKHIQHFLKEL